MDGLSNQEILFVGTAFLFQIALIIHFALRKWFFASYIMQYGWGMYALSLPAVLVSLIMLAGRMDWGFWLGGFIVPYLGYVWLYY